MNEEIKNLLEKLDTNNKSDIDIKNNIIILMEEIYNYTPNLLMYVYNILASLLKNHTKYGVDNEVQ